MVARHKPRGKEKVKEQAERLLKKAEDAKTASEAALKCCSNPCCEVARIGAKHNATVVVLDSRAPGSAGSSVWPRQLHTAQG